MQPGLGPCAGKTLSDVLTALYAGYPDWVDSTVLHQPGQLDDGGTPFIYAYQKAEGGFAIALQRFAGACPPCSDVEFGYFETDTACMPAQVDYYHFSQPQGCLEVEGSPRWGVPVTVDPLITCGADKTPQDVSGLHMVRSFGTTRTGCGPLSPGKPIGIDGLFGILIVQNPSDLSKGTVMLSDTGFPLLDGRMLTAELVRRQFHVFEVSESTKGCAQSQSIEVRYDFEGGCGEIHVSESNAGCAGCTWHFDAALGPE